MEEKLFLARLGDLFDLCDKYGCARFSAFTDGAQQALIEDKLKNPADFSAMLWGGYDGAERKVYGVFPEWEQPDKAAFPIKAVRVVHSERVSLSHRDYLGSVLGLGLDRSRTGDIITDDSGAYIFALEDTAEYIASNLKRAGRQNVKCKVIAPEEVPRIERGLEELCAVAASARLDAMTAAALGVSRGRAAELVKAGRVSVNHRPRSDGAGEICEGDLLSVRGYGRFLTEKIGAKTRSGRLHIVFKKY